MTAPSREDSGFKPLPWVAVGVTIVLCAIAVHQQITQGHVDTIVLAFLTVHVMHWSGRGIEALLKRWTGDDDDR